MVKRLFSAIYVVLTLLILCGCAYFETEYEVIEDYAPPVQSESDEYGKISVSDINSLQQAIRTIISNRESTGKIVFDSSYEGDPTADMSKACWQVRSQDALCAYWVENISYELSKIVTYYEARLKISYSGYINNSAEIVYLPYSAEIEDVLKNALTSGMSKLVILVDHSMYTAEDVSRLVLDVYRKNPVCTPAQPLPTVNMFSGSNMQRLYEITFYYEHSEYVLAHRRELLAEFLPFAELDTKQLSDSDKARTAFEYIAENCRVSLSSAHNTAYDALVEGEADSEGIALAFVELCRQLGLECVIVYGQHDWQEHCWNIVGIDDYFCHIDAGLLNGREPDDCFLKSDEAFWESYRWDMSSYPACTAQPVSDEAATPEEEIDMDEAALTQEAEASAESEDEAVVVLEALEEIAEYTLAENNDDK